MMNNVLPAATTLLCTPLLAMGDEVVLKKGSVLRGIVHEKGDEITPELDHGKVTLDHSMIKESVGTSPS